MRDRKWETRRRRRSSGYGDREGDQWDGIGEKGEMGDERRGWIWG